MGNDIEDHVDQAIAWRRMVLASLTSARNELTSAYEQAKPISLERMRIARAIEATTQAALTTQTAIEDYERRRRK